MKPDAPAVRPNTSELLPFAEYDYVIVSYSGGKDSLACLLHLLDSGVPRSKMELWHQHIDGEPGTEGLMDWPVTEAYVKATGRDLGVPVKFQWKDGGFEREMLREDALTAPVSFEDASGRVVTVQPSSRAKPNTRRKFPQTSGDLSVRWCSAYLKIDVAARAINNDPRFLGKKTLLVTGERREESSNRAKYAEIEKHKCSNGRRRVDQWRAIIDWDEGKVWDAIRRHGVVPHPAYYLGWGRVSCLACIFADRNQWASIREIDPARFGKIASYEQEFGCTIQRKKSVREQADAGEVFPEVLTQLMARSRAMGYEYPESIFTDDWKMPAGAFKKCGGPS